MSPTHQAETREDVTLTGHAGTLVGTRWESEGASWIALLVHGYGEHVGRYEWVAATLDGAGAVVYAVDHVGHGRSDGERVLVPDFERVVDDLRLVEERARAEHPDLPVVLVGHSMGGMIAARYAQRHGAGLAAVVLSGPVLGSWAPVTDLLEEEVIPETPIDPDTLSRDPAVGAAYVADPLVWHGAFKRPTVEAFVTALATITDAGAITDVPVLWLHGKADALVPIEATREGWAAIAGADSGQKSYPGARHEIFNETNRDEVLDDVLDLVEQHVDDVTR